MNFVLFTGDRMYNSFIDEYLSNIPQNLAHDQLEIIHEVNVHGNMLQPTIYSGELYGTVGVDAAPGSLASNLGQALETALQMSNSILITFNDVTMSVTTDGTEFFFLFDSHSRNENGYASSDGASALFHFQTLDQLLSFLQQHMMEIFLICLLFISHMLMSMQV